MQAKGKNYIRISGVIEIILGVMGIVLMYGILSGTETVAGAELTIAMVYALAFTRIALGILVIIFSNKAPHYKVIRWCAYILLIFVLITSDFSGSISNLVGVFIAIAIPSFMIYGAQLNKKSIEE